jgi:hypothetical protein
MTPHIAVWHRRQHAMRHKASDYFGQKQIDERALQRRVNGQLLLSFRRCSENPTDRFDIRTHAEREIRHEDS